MGQRSLSLSGSIKPSMPATRSHIWFGNIVLEALSPASNLGAIATIAIVVLADRDGDGMPDSHEAQVPCLSMFLADCDADPDGNGLSSLGEWRLGTDPCRADTDSDGIALLGFLFSSGPPPSPEAASAARSRFPVEPELRKLGSDPAQVPVMQHGGEDLGPGRAFDRDPRARGQILSPLVRNAVGKVAMSTMGVGSTAFRTPPGRRPWPVSGSGRPPPWSPWGTSANWVGTPTRIVYLGGASPRRIS